MTITPEMIAAYADGELDGAERDRVERALAENPALVRQVEAHRALKARLSAHFAPILDAPLPEALTRAVQGQPEAEILSLDAARRARAATSSNPTRSRWAWGAGAALAASLALAVVLNRPTPSGGFGYADAQLAAALDTQLSGTPAAGAPVRVMLSFANARGDFCRGYSGQAGAGIACRDARGWRLEKAFGGAAGEDGVYRQAGSADPRLMAAVQDMASGPALDADAEKAAIARHWKR